MGNETTKKKELAKAQEVTAGGKKFKVHVSEGQKLSFKGRTLDLEYPDHDLLVEMAKTKGKLVQLVSEEKKPAASAGAAAKAKP